MDVSSLCFCGSKSHSHSKEESPLSRLSPPHRRRVLPFTIILQYLLLMHKGDTPIHPTRAHIYTPKLFPSLGILIGPKKVSDQSLPKGFINLEKRDNQCL